jgi:tripartite-type tricarboxylate transporter receptor subunit TctC
LEQARLLGALLLALVPAVAAAQTDFPNRPVRLLVPFPAGGPTDVAARLLSEALRPHLGQPVVVENRGGGGGVIGTELVAASAPDGYTLLLSAPGSLVVTPAAKSLKYDVDRDLAPIAQVFRSAQLLVANPRLGVKTFPDFVAYAKANPGKVNVGSAGLGTLPHLSLELMKRETGVDVTHIPYRGTGSAVADLIGGQIDVMFGDIAVLKPNVLSGTLVPLAITSPERSPSLPDLRTMAEFGYPQLAVEAWGGLLAPRGLPAPVLRRLDEAVQKALRDPRFRDGSAKQDWSAFETSPDKFATYLAAEAERWGTLIRTSGIKIE